MNSIILKLITTSNEVFYYRGFSLPFGHCFTVERDRARLFTKQEEVTAIIEKVQTDGCSVLEDCGAHELIPLRFELYVVASKS